MIKSMVSMIVAVIILLIGGFYENFYITKQFKDFSRILSATREKVENKDATMEDMKALQSSWLNKKKNLYMVVSHTEIKEFELWISEAITLVRDEKWSDAVSKLEVVDELTREIPKSFILSLENLL